MRAWVTSAYGVDEGLWPDVVRGHTDSGRSLA